MDSEPERRTINIRSGPVVAEVRDGILRARGMPYGTAQRFKPAEAAAPWTDPRDCTKKAPICPQLPFEFEFVLGKLPPGPPHDENCLTASVACPATAPDTGKLPVLVWIHGGANVAGGADLNVFDTAKLARRGVVVVSIQYRLGIFGAIVIEGVAQPNLCVLDQILALKWVRTHIDAFGGDPERVTIMGQSAGAAAVYAILLSEAADGLYNKTVLISAPLGVPKAKNEFRKMLSDLAKKLMGDDPSKLSSKEMLEVQKEVLAVATAKGNAFAACSPVLGQYPLCAEGDVQSRLTSMTDRVEMLTGWTADDCLPFLYMIPKAKRLLSIPVLGRWLLVLIGRIATNMIFLTKSKYLHISFLAAGGKSTSFCFEYFPPGATLRACHCIEMPLMFGDWVTFKDSPFMQGNPNGPAQREAVKGVVEKLGEEVKNLFAGFAKGQLSLSSSHLKIDENFVLAKA